MIRSPPAKVRRDRGVEKCEDRTAAGAIFELRESNEPAPEYGMAEYRQYCPVARAAEVFADRWTPLIVRELLANIHHFNQLERGLPGISRSLLASRLRYLEDRGIVERLAAAHGSEYHLTEAGRDLQRVVDVLGAWGVRWAFGEPRPEELDPVLLLWKIRRRLRVDLLPAHRVVIEFDFTGPGGRRLWLVLERREASICLRPPGFDSDLIVKSDLRLFYRVWVGYVDYEAAVRSGSIRVDGLPALTRSFPRWLMWSPMAPYVREEQQRQRRSTHVPGARLSQDVEAARRA
jgi:DNA-binding HxlR family transcriptional regulator